jgi:hypothetical protein
VRPLSERGKFGCPEEAMSAAAPQYTDDNAQALADYVRAGAARAKALGNRGPARFTADGRLAPDIVETYLDVGFYIFEKLFDQEELALLRAEMHAIHDRLPVGRKSQLDRNGQAAIGAEQAISPFMWSKPLADPQGGTPEWKRAPVKMIEGVLLRMRPMRSFILCAVFSNMPTRRCAPMATPNFLPSRPA